jgi:tetratricopeptide (TPR) repeat protein
MKLTPFRALAATFLLLPAPWAGAEDAGTPAELISRLGSESYADREKASQDLWKLGEGALELLKQAAAGNDPEVAKRARELIRKIDLGILPDSSPAIIELVMFYDKGGPSERRKVLISLKKLKAWRQMLKLYAMEKDPATLPMLAAEIEGVALQAARTSLVADPPNPAEAIAYLKMARPGPAEWMGIASIHRSMGTLDEETKAAADDKSPEGGIRRYSLLAVAGKTTEAAKAAEAAGLKTAAWRMHILEGDPLPWIKGAGTGEDEVATEGISEYREWAVNQWSKGVADLKFEPHFLALANSADDDKQSAGISFLLLTRDYASAERILLKERPLEAFVYFEESERLDEAISALGLDPANPDFSSWAATRFEAMAAKPDDSDTQEEELQIVGGFLAEHGMEKELHEAYLPGLVSLLAANEDQFIQFASRIFRGSDEEEGTVIPQRRIVGPVFELIPKYAKEDDQRWQEIIKDIFGPESAASILWTWLAEIEPGLDRTQRLEKTGSLLGILPAKEGLRKPFLDKAWESFAKANAADQSTRLDVLARISSRTGDPREFYKVIEAGLAKGIFKEELSVRQRMYLGVLGEWDKARDLWQEQVKKNPVDPVSRAYLSAALARSGDAAGAAREEAMASRLALGDTAVEEYCSVAFSYASDFERAARWQHQAVLDCTPDSSSFPWADEIFRDAMEKGDWKLAAALGEVGAFDYAMKGPSRDSGGKAQKWRVDADTARAFARMKDDPQGSRQILQSIQNSKIGAGELADHFFPGLRAVGMVKEHDVWFEQSWKEYQPLVARFPNADNMFNSIAWAASRANRHLDEAEAMLNHSLELKPGEANYLDSMGEIFFARKNREKALDWSRRANSFQPLSPLLLAQYKRFESGEFPLP